MADALCGPSNPLQSFRKQTQLDRTLQQDRLVGAPSSAQQGFRSHDPRTGSLDADLDAFEHAPPSLLELQQPAPFASFFKHQPLAPQPAGWAADFQRLHISQTPSPGPVPVSHFRTEAPLVKSTNGAWQNDFMRQSGNVTPVTASFKGKEALRHLDDLAYDSQHNQLHRQMVQDPYKYIRDGPTMLGRGPIYAAQGYNFQQHTQGQEQVQEQGQDIAQMSDEAFEAAFQDAFMAEAQALQQQQPSPILQPEQGHDADLMRDNIRIGSDAINYTEVKDRTLDQDTRDADELARTAGQLLSLVQHDTSEKFKNSQFLGLMQKLRDREVEVKNNDMEFKSTSPQLQEQSRPVVEPQPLNPYPAATDRKENDWMFPDMNDIYAPTNNDLDTASRDYSASDLTRLSSGPQLTDPMYHSGSDEFPASEAPRSQIQALHPGGKLYPHSPQQDKVEMSGAVDHNISVDDFEAGYEENSALGRRFGGQSVGA